MLSQRSTRNKDTRALAPQPVERMHRLLVCYLLRHWQHPAGLDDLVAGGFAQLQRLPLERIRTDPWRCVFISLHRAARPITQGALHERCEPLRLAPLIDSLHQSINRLPRLHRRSLQDVVATGGLLMDDDSIGYGLRLVCLTQARALIRCQRTQVDSDAPVDDPLWTAARSAAFWTLNFASLDAAETEEFGDWVRSNPLHLHELLIACADELLVRLLTQRMWGSAHE